MLDNNISIKTNNPINDNVNKPKVRTEQALPFDLIDPTKVTKAAKHDQSNQTGQNLSNYNPDSVFDKFVKSLQNSPVLYESAKKLLLNKQFINHSIKNDPVLNTLYESFLQSIVMNDAEILNFLKYQQGTYTKFHGEFFDSLRTLLRGYPNNKDFQMVLRNFLRSYDCFVSVDETNKSINAALESIQQNIPELLKKNLSEITGKMIHDNSKGLALNLNILKNEILPFMGRYISKMNDFGPVRDYVSVLVHNIVRLEAASKENFADSLESLFEFVKYNFDVDEKYMESLKLSLINTYESTSKINNNSVDSFLKMLESGIKNSENPVNKNTMEEMAESLLFSQNVHIPLTHMFLPLSYNGMFMFSEIWIGKTYEERQDKKRKHEITQAYKAFITFDIQNVGYFETILVLKETVLNLDIYIPSNLTSNTWKIKDDLRNLLSKNNLNVADIKIQESIRKRKFNEIFTNLIERKSGVDVTI